MIRKRVMDIQLSDLTTTYPDIGVPGFPVQQMVTGKKEFDELRSTPRETLSGSRGTFFKHQKVVQRYMRFGKNIFLIHDAGTGKTCTIAAVAEYYKENRGQIRHVYIIANGKTQKNEFKKQLACICTPPGTYDTEAVKRADLERTQRKAVTNEIKKWYTVTTTVKFALNLWDKYHVLNSDKKSETDEKILGDNHEISQRFSNSIFVIDEIQLFKINPRTDVRIGRDRTVIYASLWRLFHLAENSKVILASATPMVDSVEEIAPHLNLILPTDFQIPNLLTRDISRATRIPILEGPDINFETVTAEGMRPYLQGRISYVRSLITGAIRTFVGTKVEFEHEIRGEKQPSYLVLDEIILSPKQRDVYIEASGGTQSESGNTINDIFTRERQVLNFIFPDGSSGDEGFKRYTIENIAGISYSPTPELDRWLRGSGEMDENGHEISMRSLSAKAHKIVTRTVNGLSLRELAVSRSLKVENLAGRIINIPIGIIEEWMGAVRPDSQKERRLEKFLEDNDVGIDYSVAVAYNMTGSISVLDEHFMKQLAGDMTLDTFTDQLVAKLDNFANVIGLTSTSVYMAVGRLGLRRHSLGSEMMSLLERRESTLGEIALQSGKSVIDVAGLMAVPGKTLISILFDENVTFPYVMDHNDDILDLDGSLNRKERGKRYVYSKYVHGGGAVMLGLCLEAYGFKKFDERGSVFTLEGQSVRPFCPDRSATGPQRSVRGDFMKRPRYVIVSREMPDTESGKESAFELFNSPENINGEYIKVIIVSQVGQVGINLSEVLQVDIFGPEWTPASLYQAWERAFRATSHIGTLRNLSETLVLDGQSAENLSVDVRIHLHTSVIESIDDGGSSFLEDTLESIMYKSVEWKDYQIKRFLRILKQNAIDCQINYERNVRPSDVDFSPICDYDVCRYACIDPSPEGEIDTTTYDIYYYNEIVDETIDLVISYFQNHVSLRVRDLKRVYPHVSKHRYFYYALEYLISNSVPVSNSFGFSSYIHEDGDVYYLSRTIPRADDHYSSSFYNGSLITSQSPYLKDVAEEMLSGIVYADVGRIMELSKTGIPHRELRAEIRKINFESQVSLLEMELIRVIKGEISESDSPILRYFVGIYTAMTEPIDEIKMVVSSAKKKRSRRKVVKQMEIDEDAQTVYIHILYTIDPLKRGYAEVSDYMSVNGRIRLFKPSENRWRNANSSETTVYRSILKNIIDAQKRLYEELSPIYGLFIGREFRVKNATAKSKNRNTGMVYGSYSRLELAKILHEIGAPPPNRRSEKVGRDEMVWYFNTHTKANISDWSDRKIEEVYLWLEASYSKQILGSRIANHMKNAIVETIKETPEGPVIETHVGLIYTAMGRVDDLVEDM